MQQANDDIGIVIAPSVAVRIDAVNAIKIRLPNTKNRRSRARQNCWRMRRKATQRRMQQRRRSIDVVAPRAACQSGRLSMDGLRSYFFYEGCIEDFLKPREGRVTVAPLTTRWS